MDVTGIAATATEMTQARTAEAVQLAVLKKAMNVQAEGALQLVQSASRVMNNNPPNLGNKLNTFA